MAIFSAGKEDFYEGKKMMEEKKMMELVWISPFVGVRNLRWHACIRRYIEDMGEQSWLFPMEAKHVGHHPVFYNKSDPMLLMLDAGRIVASLVYVVTREVQIKYLYALAGQGYGRRIVVSFLHMILPLRKHVSLYALQPSVGFYKKLSFKHKFLDRSCKMEYMDNSQMTLKHFQVKRLTTKFRKLIQSPFHASRRRIRV